MNITQPKEQEVFWYCWNLPKDLSRSDAIEEFKKRKPSTYKFERFEYDRRTGIARTV